MKSESVKIKVAHIVGSLNVGGAERFVIDLCRVQKKLNLKPAIISLGSPDEPLVAECKANTIPVASYGGGSLIKIFRIFFVLLKFDVIHIHSPHALKFLNILLPFLAKKIVYTRHGAAPLTAKHWLELHVKANKYVDAVTFVSQEGLDNFQAQHKWHNLPSLVVDNGVLISPVIKQKSEKLRIGSVGRMIPLKHQISLLHAVERLTNKSQNSIALHFFGDGKCLNLLKQFHQETIANIEVNFHGMVSDRELIYSNIDVLVVTSETEGLSMVIIEAMANRIPVIATDVGGNPKLVINSQTGWLFSYDDDESLSDRIQGFLDNRQLIKQYGDNAFEYINAKFSIESAAKKYIDLYNA
jgi:glycosyltransferase involved in cell wall biosynthesis